MCLEALLRKLVSDSLKYVRGENRKANIKNK